jgi:excisionase family DNA binding protein
MNKSENIELLTIRETAILLRISIAAAYEIVKSGKLPSYRLGKSGASIRVSRGDLLLYLESSRQQTPTAAPARRVHPKRKLKHLKL